MEIKDIINIVAIVLSPIIAVVVTIFLQNRSDKKKENEKLQYMEDLKNYRNTHPDEDFSDVMEGKKKRYPEHKTRQNF